MAVQLPAQPPRNAAALPRGSVHTGPWRSGRAAPPAMLLAWRAWHAVMLLYSIVDDARRPLPPLVARSMPFNPVAVWISCSSIPLHASLRCCGCSQGKGRSRREPWVAYFSDTSFCVTGVMLRP